MGTNQNRTNRNRTNRNGANCHSPLQHTHDTFAHTYIRINIWPTHVVGANGNSPTQETFRPHKGAFRPLKGAIHLNHNNQEL